MFLACRVCLVLCLCVHTSLLLSTARMNPCRLRRVLLPSSRVIVPSSQSVNRPLHKTLSPRTQKSQGLISRLSRKPMHLFTQEPFGDLDDQDLLEGTHNTDRGICEGREGVMARLEGSRHSPCQCRALPLRQVPRPSDASWFQHVFKGELMSNLECEASPMHFSCPNLSRPSAHLPLPWWQCTSSSASHAPGVSG